MQHLICKVVPLDEAVGRHENCEIDQTPECKYPFTFPSFTKVGILWKFLSSCKARRGIGRQRLCQGYQRSFLFDGRSDSPHTQPPLHPAGLVPELQKDQIRAASKALLLLRLRSEGKQMKDGKAWVAKWLGGVQACTEMLFHFQKIWLMIAAPIRSGKLCRQTSCATQTALSPSSST